jgi:peroxiredoxin
VKGKSLKSNPWKLLTIFAIFTGAAWIWLTRVPPVSGSGEIQTAPRRGFSAPDFELADSEGNLLHLSELRGHALLVNFWASWCAPCRAEMPALQRVYNRYKDQGFIILAVNTANQDNRGDALAFAGRLGLEFPLLFDERGDVFADYGVRALPTSFFIDPQGVIQQVVIGGPMSEALISVHTQQILEQIP